MKEITNNEMVFMLSLLKTPEREYNANSIARQIGISSMGALKIAKRLENEGIVNSRELGKARFYKLNLGSGYVRQYANFLLRREAEQASPYVKVWVSELRKLKSADAAVLFGSILNKGENANDVDVLLVTDKKRFPSLKKEVDEINLVNTKKLHPIYQTVEDVKENIRKGDQPLLNALKGIVALGEDLIIRLVAK